MRRAKISGMARALRVMAQGLLGVLGAWLAQAQVGTNEVLRAASTPYLTWLYSQDARVAGYYVKYGVIDQPGTNVFDAAMTNLVDLELLQPGFTRDRTNWIFVTAYDAPRNESGPSTVLYCYLLPSPPPPPPRTNTLTAVVGFRVM